MQLVGVFDTIKKVIQIIKIEWATGISSVAHYDYWELHVISLRLVSCNLCISALQTARSWRRVLSYSFWFSVDTNSIFVGKYTNFHLLWPLVFLMAVACWCLLR